MRNSSVRCVAMLWAISCMSSEGAAAAAESAIGDAVVTPLALPGARGLVSLDYFVYDPAGHRLWVPASNTGKVDLIDVTTDQVSVIAGFRIAEVDFKGKRTIMGPSSVTLGDGVAYVGNRGDSSICVVRIDTLKIAECLPIGTSSAGLSAAPDALTYVAAVRELWVTRGVPPMGIASDDQAITVLDVTDPPHPQLKAKIPLRASAEGFAVDNLRGRFYTSLEEQGVTIAIDVRSHAIVARWRSGCDEPHGLALDAQRGLLFVACTARVVSVDVMHGGHIVGSIATGAGLDNIDYSPTSAMLYAAASEAALLTVARVDTAGKFVRITTVPTVKGARGVVAADAGRAYVMDPYGARILKVTFH